MHWQKIYNCWHYTACLSTVSPACSSFHSFSQVVKHQSAISSVCSHFICRPQFHRCSSYNLELSPSSSLNVYQPRHFSSSSQDSLSPAGLPISSAPSFLHLRFGFCLPLCTFTNYIYLLAITFFTAVLTAVNYRYVQCKINSQGCSAILLYN